MYIKCISKNQLEATWQESMGVYQEDQSTICCYCRRNHLDKSYHIPLVWDYAAKRIWLVGNYCSWTCLQTFLYKTDIPIYRKVISQTGLYKRLTQEGLKNKGYRLIVLKNWNYETFSKYEIIKDEVEVPIPPPTFFAFIKKMKSTIQLL